MAKKVKLKAKRQILGRTVEGEPMSFQRDETFEVDEFTAKDLLNAGYAEAVRSRAKKEEAVEE